MKSHDATFAIGKWSRAVKRAVVVSQAAFSVVIVSASAFAGHWSMLASGHGRMILARLMAAMGRKLTLASTVAPARKVFY